MIENDFKFWNKSIIEWTRKAEEYLALGDNAGFERCMNRADVSLQNRMEAEGLIVVVSGRKGMGLHPYGKNETINLVLG